MVDEACKQSEWYLNELLRFLGLFEQAGRGG